MAHLHSELRGTPVSQSVPRRSKSTVGFAIKKGKCEQQKSWEGSPRPGRRVARVKGVGRERLKKGSSNVVRGNRVTTYGSINSLLVYVCARIGLHETSLRRWRLQRRGLRRTKIGAYVEPLPENVRSGAR